jgi:hypothetical protein
MREKTRYRNDVVVYAVLENSGRKGGVVERAVLRLTKGEFGSTLQWV